MDIHETLYKALEYHQQGNLKEAEHLYRKILSSDLQNFYALHYLGVLHCQRGNYNSAIEHIEKALQINPSDAHAYYNLGISLQGKRQREKAIDAYKNALRLNPGNADAFVNMGIIYKEKGELDNAISCFRSALQLNPDHLASYNNLGIVLKQKGHFDDSIISFHKALQLNPTSSEILLNLGTVFHDKGSIDEAISCYQKALTIKPSVNVFLNLGRAFIEQGRNEEALETFDKVLEQNPASFAARLSHCIAQIPVIHANHSGISAARRRYHEELLTLHNTLSLSNIEEIEEASKAVGTLQPFYLAYQGLNDRELQRLYGNIVCRIMGLRYPEFAEFPPLPLHKQGDALRIGFVSGYFHNHSIWKIPLKGWVENLDKRKFDLYGYYTWKKKDIETAAARHMFARFVEDVYSFEELCSIIRKDNLHVLIFPEIGMDPLTLRLAALRLAPVQCASWGHPSTTGLPTIDYFLSSDLIEPPEADSHYTEKLIRLPNLSAYYTPPEIHLTGLTRDDFGLSPDSLIYHCCQSLYKYLPQFDEIFPRIAQMMGSCTFLFCSHPRSTWVTEQFKKRIHSIFEQFDLNADNFVVFLPFLGIDKYNALYHLSDVFLDPIGWSGCNSALEALSCNLPVLTFPQELMRSRDSAAILRIMGIQETIASSLDEYINIAVTIGKDAAWRNQISDKISANKSKLHCDNTCITALENFIEEAVKQ